MGYIYGDEKLYENKSNETINYETTFLESNFKMKG